MENSVNRPLPTIIILLIFWANVAFGLPTVCCCPPDLRDVVDRADNDCSIGSHDSNCNRKVMWNSNCNCGCISFKCNDGLDTLGFFESKPVLPEHQVVAFRTLMISSGDFLTTDWLNRLKLPSRLNKPVSLLLQICSFLS